MFFKRQNTDPNGKVGGGNCVERSEHPHLKKSYKNEHNTGTISILDVFKSGCGKVWRKAEV